MHKRLSYANVARSLAMALGALAVALSGLAPAEAQGTTVQHPAHLGANVRGHRTHHGLQRLWRHARAHAAIIGGTPAESGAFPWLAFVVDEFATGYGLCTGTVVAPNLILTAAHCAENRETRVVNEPSGYSIVTGNVDLLERTLRCCASRGDLP
jgi:hypothetical protein